MTGSLLSILLLGFLLGIKHAIEPDHVIAVSTIASVEGTVSHVLARRNRCDGRHARVLRVVAPVSKHADLDDDGRVAGEGIRHRSPQLGAGREMAEDHLRLRWHRVANAAAPQHQLERLARVAVRPVVIPRPADASEARNRLAVQ